MRAPKRIPGRAVAAALVLTLTACGSAPPTTSGSHQYESLVLTSRLEAGFGLAPAAPISWIAPQATQALEPDLAFDLIAVDAAARTIDTSVADMSELPQPAWWSGRCNAGRHVGAYALGASFRGVQACGPQPGKTTGRLVFFFPGAWGEYEWQCTELVYRFLYLAYGVAPYNGNGDQVVDNYRPSFGGNLVKVMNGSGALPAPGDVLSYVSVHTSIVTRVEVDAEGNGTVDVLEQNAPNNGFATLKVSHGKIAGVKNWLHRQLA